MTFTGKISDISIDYQTNKPRITFLADTRDTLQQIEELKDFDKLSIEAKKYKKRRSLDANRLCLGTYGETCRNIKNN